MTTTREKLLQRVDVMDRDRENLLRVAQRMTFGTIAKLRAGVIRAYLDGTQPTQAFAIAQAEIEDALLDGLIVSHVTATARTWETMRRVRGIQLDRTDFAGLLEKAMNGADIETSQLIQIRNRYAAVAADSAQEAIDAAKELIGKSARKIAASGINSKDGIAQLREALDSAGLPTQNPRLLETVYRTEFNAAYSDARLEANDDPAIQEILFGYEYVTVGDDRVRPTHAALDGKRFAKDSPEWKKFRPPWDWGCRCSYIEIFKDQRSLAKPSRIPTSIKVGGNRIAIEPAKGFERAA